jgi:hypothetical protein
MNISACNGACYKNVLLEGSPLRLFQVLRMPVPPALPSPFNHLGWGFALRFPQGLVRQLYSP